jgi:hypothetical protein
MTQKGLRSRNVVERMHKEVEIKDKTNEISHRSCHIAVYTSIETATASGRFLTRMTGEFSTAPKGIES